MNPLAELNFGFSFAEVTGPGSYALAFDAPFRTVVVVAGTRGDPQKDCCWGASPDDSGTLELTEFSDQRLTGTFELALQPQGTSGASAPLIVKKGEFDIGRDDP